MPLWPQIYALWPQIYAFLESYWPQIRATSERSYWPQIYAELESNQTILESNQTTLESNQTFSYLSDANNLHILPQQVST